MGKCFPVCLLDEFDSHLHEVEVDSRKNWALLAYWYALDELLHDSKKMSKQMAFWVKLYVSLTEYLQYVSIRYNMLYQVAAIGMCFQEVC